MAGDVPFSMVSNFGVDVPEQVQVLRLPRLILYSESYIVWCGKTNIDKVKVIA